MLLLACLLQGAFAVDYSNWNRWRHTQTLQLPPSQGLVRVQLPASTLGLIEVSCADLRLVSSQGREIPWALELPSVPRHYVRDLAAPTVALRNGSTEISFECPTDLGLLEGLELVSPQARFNKPVRMLSSQDGVEWSVLADAVPLSKVAGRGLEAYLALPKAASLRFLRLLIDDARSEGIQVDRVRLHYREEENALATAVDCFLAAPTQEGTETRWPIDFGTAGLHLSSLHLNMVDPVFRRHVRLVRRLFSGERIEEQLLAEGFVENRPDRTQLDLTVERRIPAAQLILVIENGDNPPLELKSVGATARPVRLVFVSPEDGHCRLFAGAHRVALPQYDIAAMVTDFRHLQLSEGRFGPIEDNPAYVKEEGGPEFPTLGQPLDTRGWGARKVVQISRPGIQILELDLEVLARAGSNLQDIRLLRGNQQVPYVLENCAYLRRLSLVAKESPQELPKASSRWQIQLPYAGLPLRQLHFLSSTPVFERNLRLYELRHDHQGGSYQFQLGQGVWRQQPQSEGPFVLAVPDRPQGALLQMETYDGDNLPITLDRVEALCPRYRLHFKTKDAQPLSLYYGNTSAAEPSYDLALVGTELLAGDAVSAQLGAEELTTDQAPEGSGWITYLHSGWVFWCSISLVVSTLIYILARFLPKAPGGRS
jgi:hypothetical protein